MRTRYIAIAALWISAALVAVGLGVAKPHSDAPILCLGVALIGTMFLMPRVEKGSFQIVGPGEVTNSAGYSVKITGAGLVYREGERQITLGPSGSAAGPAILKLDPATPFRWDGTDSANGIDKQGQDRIRLRITRAISFLQFTSTQRKK